MRSTERRALAVSGGYAAAVLAIAVFVLVAGGLGAVWLILLTLPSSVLVQFIPVQGDLFLLCLTLGGLAQAWLLWLALRRRPAPDIRPR
jgi:hypothetical protein